ncbi:MAG: hypothetical protein V1708_04720 [Candidatus Micrarchaeota archaeon]
MGNHVIKAETGHVNLSPVLFHNYARQYLECRRSFKDEINSPVPYFLICRAIELELKAKHLESKLRQEVKRKYGHNLKKSYDELSDSERTLEASEYIELVRASEIYDIPNKGFEYVSVFDAVTGLKNFPNLAVLERVAEKLIGE